MSGKGKEKKVKEEEKKEKLSEKKRVGSKKIKRKEGGQRSSMVPPC